LQAAPAALASAFAPVGWSAFARTAKILPPFSRFVDIAATAGLRQTMFYGEGASATYVTEIMGGGCAFFDYDNDGWMDVFILGGRRLESIPPGASNRLYRASASATTTTTG